MSAGGPGSGALPVSFLSCTSCNLTPGYFFSPNALLVFPFYFLFSCCTSSVPILYFPLRIPYQILLPQIPQAICPETRPWECSLPHPLGQGSTPFPGPATLTFSVSSFFTCLRWARRSKVSLALVPSSACIMASAEIRTLRRVGRLNLPRRSKIFWFRSAIWSRGGRILSLLSPLASLSHPPLPSCPYPGLIQAFPTSGSHCLRDKLQAPHPELQTLLNLPQSRLSGNH